MNITHAHTWNIAQLCTFTTFTLDIINPWSFFIQIINSQSHTPATRPCLLYTSHYPLNTATCFRWRWFRHKTGTLWTICYNMLWIWSKVPSGMDWWNMSLCEWLPMYLPPLVKYNTYELMKKEVNVLPPFVTFLGYLIYFYYSIYQLPLTFCVWSGRIV